MTRAWISGFLTVGLLAAVLVDESKLMAIVLAIYCGMQDYIIADWKARYDHAVRRTRGVLDQWQKTLDEGSKP